jgi:hypothetical protein
MDRSFDALSGSPGHTFETKKLPDGNWKVTCPTIEDKEWIASTEIEAIQDATREVYNMATRGEI